jgi:hypothetical protein
VDLNHRPLGPEAVQDATPRSPERRAFRPFLEHDRPRPKPIDYVEAKKRQAEKNRAATKAGQDIQPIPEVEDYQRRQATRASLRLFCETYFPKAFYRAWSEDHLKVIAKIERAVKEGGLFAFAMPRGSGKTTLARLSGLWAVLVGYRPFVCLIGATADRARAMLESIQTELECNDELLRDFRRELKGVPTSTGTIIAVKVPS